jgi:acetyltransferase-like isoleucine patch superfamily enzyme
MSFRGFISECYEHWITHGPSNQLFSKLRWKFYNKRLVQGSGYFTSLTGLWIPYPETVFIGDQVSINRYVIIDSSDAGRINIGNNCLIGPYVLIRSADHKFSNPDASIQCQGHAGGEIMIEDNCWIGGHVTITHSVTIGTGSVIGANSVVTKDIPPHSLAAGNPAKVIRSLP